MVGWDSIVAFGARSEGASARLIAACWSGCRHHCLERADLALVVCMHLVAFMAACEVDELRELGLQVIRCLRCAALFVGLADEERPPVVEEAGGPIHIRLAPVVVRGWGGIQLYM